MTRPMALQLGKEVRVALPIWSASLIAVAAGGFATGPQFESAALLAYGLGAVTLGAHAVGHEFTHQTIGSILSLPIERRRLFLVKIGAVTPLILALAAVAWVSLFGTAPGSAAFWRDVSLCLLPVLIGLFVAPSLASLCRGTLAGVVFAIGLPGLLMVIGRLVGLAASGTAGELDRFTLWAPGWGIPLLVCIGAVGGPWAFARLEWVEGTGREFDPFGWARARTRLADIRRGPRSAIACLLRKELRLQQMTFVVVVLYILAAGALAFLARLGSRGDDLAVLTPLYSALVAVLAGAQASAEERRHGTLQSQLLLPIRASHGWLLKAGTVVASALLLGLALPIALEAVLPVWRFHQVALEFGLLLVLISCVSLYASSLASNGVRAMVLALPALLLALLLVRIGRWLHGWSVSGLVPPSGFLDLQDAFTATRWAGGIAIVGAAALLWSFAFQNHRSADRPGRRVLVHALWVVLWALAGTMALETIDWISAPRV